MKKKLTEQVLFCLESNPETRNNDLILTTFLWCKFYKDKVIELITSTSDNPKPRKFKYVALVDMLTLPREDNIKRIRAKIQNEHNKFLPTDPEVRRKRRIAEEKWLSWSRSQ